jgi:V/A-type H+-transporting ATPase subunit D
MAQIKLTKTELRDQQLKLAQLEKYLPTLKLKKSMLQSEVADAKLLARQLENQLNQVEPYVQEASALFELSSSCDIELIIKVESIMTDVENIAGVEVPIFQSIKFAPVTYSLLQTPFWLERAIETLRSTMALSVQKKIAWQRAACLEKELQEVSIRVNLFEKILIPRAGKQIRKIKVFLQDQELAAIARSKVAKSKHRPQFVAISNEEVS